MNKRRILAAIDGSEYSDKVIDKTIELAKLLSAEVVLLYCHKKYPQILGYPIRDQLISEIRDNTEKVVAPYVTKLKASGVEYTERYLEGPAGKTIPDAAEREHCELIVMGSKGRSDIESLIIGSVTHKVLHMAKTSVLVVK